MQSENPQINSIEEATRIDQLLTPEGMQARFARFVTGSVVRESDKTFFGKDTVISAIQNHLGAGGIAVLEGGYRSGKTSILYAVSDRLKNQGKADATVIIDFSELVSLTPQQITEKINSDIIEYIPSGTGVIAFDEFDACRKESQDAVLDCADKLKKKGHKLLFSVIGDLHGSSHSELPRATKDRLLQISGGNTVVNELLDGNEMRSLLTRGGQSFFTEPLLKYLIAESGGHPYLANAIASKCFELLKSKNMEPGELPQELKSKISALENFPYVVDLVIDAGFDPLTWEWKGEGEVPDASVYTNMLPRYTSTIFKSWLTDNMRKKERGIQFG